ncbi:MAG: hypothetical protein KBC66_00095 [Kiritimatiellae bacterium]|jgi:hypothetical protein|nr:hypothetical protein [Kiritimatiellia bacterium]HQQ61265.1 hypothetical protein [Kiritimatiellia bacterium]
MKLNERSENLQVVLPGELKARLSKVAENLRLSITEVINLAVVTQLKIIEKMPEGLPRNCRGLTKRKQRRIIQ